MSAIQSVKLELLRSGPAHNQLLSPLTPYLALAGSEGPVTVSIPFEHQQLLTRLDRLRYVVDGGPIVASQREAEVHEIGEALGRVLGQVPGLVAELSMARSRGGGLTHLRLSMTAYELALVPFELAIGADGFPGSGSPLVLQSIAPITLTREVRRGQPLPVSWDRKPRILFAFAAPGDLPPVPAPQHLDALRRALDPWIHWQATPEARILEVKEYLTVVPNASLQKIRRECAQTEYTHVHILAHGERRQSGHYALDLSSDIDDTAKDSIDGEALAMAITARDSLKEVSSRPTVVSLATCDSGNLGSVMNAGSGSIAHALHAAGIPWVFASQFPLYMHASTIAAEVLYTGLLRGHDPRLVLHTLRQRLRTESTATHDWASIVAYAAVPWDFEQQVERFRNRQTHQRVEVKFDEAQRRTQDVIQRSAEDQVNAAVAKVELGRIYDVIRDELDTWYNALPSDAPAHERWERLGMRAAAEKRIGNLMEQTDPSDPRAATPAYERACELYDQASKAESLTSLVWVLTQYLSMRAVLTLHDATRLATLRKELGSWWGAARQMAKWSLRAATGRERAFAFGTLAELELLGTIYDDAERFLPEKVKDEIVALCRQLQEAVGKDDFSTDSTRRQFLRYAQIWPYEPWMELAKAAATALSVETSSKARRT